MGYKVLQAVTAALEMYVKESGKTNMKVWGYRNVWFRFQPFEVNTIFPVSLMTIATLDHMFLSSFESQKKAEFPAHEIEGPFCDMSRMVQREPLVDDPGDPWLGFPEGDGSARAHPVLP